MESATGITWNTHESRFLKITPRNQASKFKRFNSKSNPPEILVQPLSRGSVLAILDGAIKAIIDSVGVTVSSGANERSVCT